MARLFALAAAVLCLSRLALADVPAPAPAPSPAATAEQVHQTVERAMGYMQAESAAWVKTRRCAACHHVPIVLWSINEAGRNGYPIDKQFVAETAEATFGSPEKLISSRQFNDPADPPDTRPLGKAVKISTAFAAVAARSMLALTDGQKQTLQLIADEIVKKQRDDGGWDFYLSRPPINESEISDAAWLIMALEGEMGPSASESQRMALKKANAWLAGVPLNNLQDKAFKVLLAARTGKPRDTMQSTIDELLALQRPDGGWAQLPDAPTDAYATGQTLYVLALAGYTAERPEIKRAIDLLVTTQKPDGSWPMTSRSSPDGSPGGSSKLLTPINCAADAWATLALSTLVPKGR